MTEVMKNNINQNLKLISKLEFRKNIETKEKVIPEINQIRKTTIVNKQ